MGCQACTGMSNSLELMIKEIGKCIQNENVSNLNFYLKHYIRRSKEPQELIMNSRLIVFGDYKLNILCYSLATGSYKSFKFLYEKCGCSIQIMNDIFEEYELDSLNIICEKNYLELAKYFLPLYFRFKKEIQHTFDTTIEFNDLPIKKEMTFLYTPIQLACYYGWIGMVDLLVNYCKTSYNRLLDIHEKNENTGENCALISVRSGNIAMVKLMYENYKLDFGIRNRYGEGALQICAVCCSKYPTKPFSEVFMFLIDVVKADLVQNHEEILLVLEDKALIAYIEQDLCEKGIIVSKKELDQIFKTRGSSNYFFSREISKENLNEALASSSYISSIAHQSSETPFNVESFMIGKFH